MTKYTAIFEDGHRIAKTDKEIKNRLDLYNIICKKRMAKEHGRLIEITAEPFGKN